MPPCHDFNVLLCPGEVGAQFKPSSVAFPVTGWTSTNIGSTNVLLSHFLAGVAASSASSRFSGGWACDCADCAGADLPRIRRAGSEEVGPNPCDHAFRNHPCLALRDRVKKGLTHASLSAEIQVASVIV